MSSPRFDAIDISHWNTITDRGLVPAFRMITLKATEGRQSYDPTFIDRWAWLRDRGTEFRGAFHWIRPDSPIREQAEWHARFVQSHGWEDGCFTQLDWEITHGRDGAPLRAMTVDEIEEFLEHHERLFGPGRCIVYGSDWVPNFVEWRNANPDVPVWYANYRTDPTRPGNGWAESERFGAAIWQWTSQGPVEGFKDGIDVNHVFDWAALYRLTNQTPQEDEVPKTVKTLWNPQGSESVYCLEDGIHISPAIRKAWLDDPEVHVIEVDDDPHAQTRASVEIKAARRKVPVDVKFPDPTPVEFPTGKITWS